MDILSHGIWAGLVSKAAARKIRRTFSFWKAFFWGMFPDLFAFTLPFIVLIYGALTGGGFQFGPPRELQEPAVANHSLIFQITPVLYSLSHSLFIFGIVFGIVSWLWIKKYNRYPLEMLGWLLHILMDIPTHSYQFYPTPFLWPISNYKFNGFAWGQWWFIILNYSTLAVFALALKYWKKKNPRP